MMTLSNLLYGAVTIVCMLIVPGIAPAQDKLPESPVLRGWIDDMKSSDRGPFKRIRWFCKDGTILPPKPYGCADRGGGSQHGEWTDRVKQLRSGGYAVANIYADLDIDALMAQPDYLDTLNQMMIEQFLIASDNGWIYRKARYYRGALQEESERKGARRLLLRLASDPEWLTRHYLAFRSAVGLLGHSRDTKSIAEVRRLSGSLAELDPEFGPLRNKMHVRPDYGDAEAVRQYLLQRKDSNLSAQYRRLADVVEAAYSMPSGAKALDDLAQRPDVDQALASLCRRGARVLSTDSNREEHFTITAQLLTELRSAAVMESDSALRLAIVDASHAMENDHFVAATELMKAVSDVPRIRQLEWLGLSIEATYGVGLISARQRDALSRALDRLEGQTDIEVGSYRRTLQYLSLLPAWSSGWQRFHFQKSVDKLILIEPRADLFLHDQLRSGPLLFFSQVLDGLLRDANQLAGVRQLLFDEDIGTGMRGLNPGLAIGRLRTSVPPQTEDFDTQGIYLLEETMSDLPPVAGILTAREGNPLSHVQLLARNLGIPNAVVDASLIPLVREWDGKRVALAVSRQGAVQLIDAATLPKNMADEEPNRVEIVIDPDLDKLDLNRTNFVALSALRERDSGRSVGPKAAKLGELHQHFPGAVADGLVIPFGIFNELLNQPSGQNGQSMFQWMVSEYRRLATLPSGSPTHRDAVDEFRGQLQNWIENADPGKAFRKNLRVAMKRVFGEDGTYGVFVRSDTNVEDLPGFTGAGLNLTVPNVVGFDNVLKAISLVWASPFGDRAYAWRQSRMTLPQHVYPAVLLQRSVAVEKSGVLVTQDIDNGDVSSFTVAVNEGVGGAVSGQASESLRVHIASGEVTLLAQATARIKRTINPDGGVDKMPASNHEHILEAREIDQLVDFVKTLPERYPAIVDSAGKTVPADVEFGFTDGRLMLFQIRPFLNSKRARANRYLLSMDHNLQRMDKVVVRLDSVPGERP